MYRTSVPIRRFSVLLFALIVLTTGQTNKCAAQGSYSYSNFALTTTITLSDDGTGAVQHNWYISPTDADPLDTGTVKTRHGSTVTFGILQAISSGTDSASLVAVTVVQADIYGPPLTTAHVLLQGTYRLDELGNYFYSQDATQGISAVCDAFNRSYTGLHNPWDYLASVLTPIHQVDVSIDSTGHGTLYWAAADASCGLLGTAGVYQSSSRITMLGWSITGFNN